MAAIGPKTADELRERGVFADIVPDDSTNEGIVAALLQVVRAGDRVLLPRARVAREVLPDTLRAAGVTVDVVTAYETLGPDDATRDVLRHALLGDPDDDTFAPVDTVAFTSSSTVRNLIDALTAAGEDARALLATRTLLSIGPITSDTLRRRWARAHARGLPAHHRRDGGPAGTRRPHQDPTRMTMSHLPRRLASLLLPLVLVAALPLVLGCGEAEAQTPEQVSAADLPCADYDPTLEEWESAGWFGDTCDWGRIHAQHLVLVREVPRRTGAEKQHQPNQVH